MWLNKVYAKLARLREMFLAALYKEGAVKMVEKYDEAQEKIRELDTANKRLRNEVSIYEEICNKKNKGKRNFKKKRLKKRLEPCRCDGIGECKRCGGKGYKEIR